MTRYQKLENEIVAGNVGVSPVLLEEGLVRLNRYLTHNPPQEGLTEMRKFVQLFALLLRAVVDLNRGGRALIKYPWLFRATRDWDMIVSRAFRNSHRTPENLWALEEKPSWRPVSSQYIIDHLLETIDDLERWAQEGPERGTIPTNGTDEVLDRITFSLQEHVRRISVSF